MAECWCFTTLLGCDLKLLDLSDLLYPGLIQWAGQLLAYSAPFALFNCVMICYLEWILSLTTSAGLDALVCSPAFCPRHCWQWFKNDQPTQSNSSAYKKLILVGIMKGVGKPFRDKSGWKEACIEKQRAGEKRKCFSPTFHQREVKFLWHFPCTHTAWLNRRVCSSGTTATR